MTTRLSCWLLLAAAIAAAAPSLVAAQGPSAEQALRLVPRQKGTDFDRPTAEEAKQCTLSITDDRRGYVVRDAGGKTLRMFLDTDGDGTVDQWRYFKNGLEVYRDIDTNGDRSADQFRWFHSEGSRWGIDRNEDGVIDQWKQISAEEVTAEVVAALGRKDARRFDRVTLSDQELTALGLGEELTQQIAEETEKLSERFQELAATQQVVSSETEWVQFSGNRPGLIPAGRDGAKQDVRFYSNVVAFVRNGDQHDQVAIGNLIQVGDGWRVVSLPELGENVAKVDILGGAIAQTPTGPETGPTTGPTEEQQKLIEQLQAIDDSLPQTSDPAKRAQLHAQRAGVVEQIARLSTTQEDRDMWLRQLADMVSAATQYGELPQGAEILSRLVDSLDEKDREVAAYIEFRRLGADYGAKVSGGNPDYVTEGGEPDFDKIQAEWMENLEQFIADYPKAPEAAEAMIQLANNYEFMGPTSKAIEWYDRITQEYPNLPVAKTAAGAKVRLTSEGKPIAFQGKTPQGQLIDLARYRGRVVLIQYWASWCEPCKADIAILKDLLSRYGQDQFSVISVNLDSTLEAMNGFLAQHKLPWANVREEGGFTSDPATQFGILNVPTMILVDQDGRLVNPNVQTADLDREVGSLLK